MISSPKFSGQIWSQLSLLQRVPGTLSPDVKRLGGGSLTIQPHPVPMTKTGEAKSSIPIYLNDLNTDKFALAPDIKVNENLFRNCACRKICLLPLKCKLEGL